MLLTTEISYRERVLGCWLGKCLGGALGMPFEGVPETVDIKREDLKILDVPNDDLELQLVWIAALKEHGLELNEEIMAEIWLRDIKFACDEYSIALRNLKNGILPPASGYVENFFADGMGAVIRSEIWALLFYDRPDAAAYFTALDASVDHWGDGVWAAIFMVVAECLAFQGKSIPEIIFEALQEIPENTRSRKALSFVLQCYTDKVPQDKAFRLVRERFNHHNFTDAVMNCAYGVFALLYGEEDFIETILLALRFGRDTDCTAASCGAFLGILKGVDCIPEAWQKKVNKRLALSDFVEVIELAPKTMNELIKVTMELREKFAAEISALSFPAYIPYVAESPTEKPDQWLILDENEHNIEEIREILLASGKCPEELNRFVLPTEKLLLDLSPFADGTNTLNLFTFLHCENCPDEAVISATADTGMTLWFDDKRILNCHNRQKMIPSFHRAEGGAAFLYDFKDKQKKLVQVKLYSCRAPLRFALIFGDLNNQYIDEFKLKI